MKCIVVEDDFDYALELEMLLENLEIELAATLDNDKDAIVSIMKNKPDFILMDIEIKGSLNGADVAKELKHLNIPVIFITSFDTSDNFEIVKDIPNSAFLTKPIKKFDLQSTLDILLTLKANKQLDQSKKEDKILMKGVKQFYHIDKNKILFIKADRNYSMVFIDNDKYLIRYKLSELEEILPDNFIRCHRSYIINLNCIQSVDFTNNTVHMNNTENIKLNLEAKKKIEDYFRILK